MKRLGTIAAVGVVVGVALGVLVRACDDEPPGERPRVPAKTDERVERTPRGPARGRPSAVGDEVAAADEPRTVDPRPTPPPSKLDERPVREVVVAVVDETGARVADALVSVRWDERMFDGLVSTGPDGVARLLGPSGGATLDVSSGPDARPVPLIGAVVRVGADQRDARIVLPFGEWVRGRVVDDAGSPIADAVVAFRAADGFQAKSEDRLDWDGRSRDGRFAVAVPRGTRGDLRYWAVWKRTKDGWSEQDDCAFQGAVADVAAGAYDVRLVCRRVRQDGAMTVLVVDPSGAPCALSRVELRRGGFSTSARGDAEGRVSFERMPCLELAACAKGYGKDALSFAWSETLPLTPAGQTVTLRLRRARLVTGTVVDESGVRVQGAIMDARIGADQADMEISDADGRFTVAVALEQAGPVRVLVETTDLPSLRGAVEVSGVRDEDVRVVVRRP